MRDRVHEYLRNAPAPVPAEEILRDVFGIHCSARAVAEKILRSMLEKDPRFVSADGLWRNRITASAADELTLERVATLFVESAAQPHERLLVRGAVFSDGAVQEFGIGENVGLPGIRELEEARLRLEGHMLAVWNRNSLRLWNRLQWEHRLPEWHGPTLTLAAIARRLVPGFREAAGLEDLAARLSLSPPASDRPGALARFLSDSIPGLLGLVPEEHRSTLRTLRAWMESEFPEPDFSRFAFDRTFLQNLPELPGVYLMRNPDGDVIYVGKARNLRRRVGSYFAPRSLRDPKTGALRAALHSLEILPAASEVDALLMEMGLIRDLRPQINRQADVHEGPESYGKQNRLLLLVPNVTLDRAKVYLLKEGAFVHQADVRLGRPPSEKLKSRIRSTFFSSRRSATRDREPWEKEIVFRWLARNRSRLNIIDVDEPGGSMATVRILTDYLLDPERLLRKVLYR
jgi:hypothetical protein